MPRFSDPTTQASPRRQTQEIAMTIKLSALAIGAVAIIATLHPAAAESYRSDVREDVREIRGDRAAIARDEARLREERSEVAKARAKERYDLERGNLAGAARDYREAQQEQRDVNAANRKLAADRAKLSHDVTDLRHDVQQHRRHWFW